MICKHRTELTCCRPFFFPYQDSLTPSGQIEDKHVYHLKCCCGCLLAFPTTTRCRGSNGAHDHVEVLEVPPVAPLDGQHQSRVPPPRRPNVHGETTVSNPMEAVW